MSSLQMRNNFSLPSATTQSSSSPDESKSLKATHKASCSECQRRKQKCNRQWPCNQCHKRNVADVCWFPQDHAPRSGWNKSEDVQRKRAHRLDSGSDDSVDDDDLEAMGYTSSHPLAAMLGDKKTQGPRDLAKVPQFTARPEDFPQLKRALEAVPPRVYVDSLLNHFLDNVNFYYYIVYPNSFLREYTTWCRERDSGGPVGVQWTCLLIMVLACSIQHADTDLTRKIEKGLGKDVQTLSQEYHNIARELHGTIPVDQSHIFSIQYLLHSCYWFKAEAKFADCWHLLGAAVREGQRIGLHQDKLTQHMSDFDREMCRRLWCILDAWDWLVSALLARPMLIDRGESTTALPALTLEEKYPVNPLLHIKLQSDLIARIFKRFGPPKNITDLADIRDYENIIRAWMKTFPKAYRFEAPDQEVNDIWNAWPWVELHRHYIQTTALSLALGPLKQFLVKPMNSDAPAIEIELRGDGVQFALGLMDAVHGFFNYVWERDTTFHFVPFCIFDTAVHLVHALMNDEDGSLPKKDESLAAIRRALDTLKQLAAATETAKKPLSHLQSLFAKLLQKKGWGGDVNGQKRQKTSPPQQQQQEQQHQSIQQRRQQQMRAPIPPATTSEVRRQVPTVMGSSAQIPMDINFQSLQSMPSLSSQAAPTMQADQSAYTHQPPYQAQYTSSNQGSYGGSSSTGGSNFDNEFGGLDAIEPGVCLDDSFPCSISTYSSATTDSSAMMSTVADYAATQQGANVGLGGFVQSGAGINGNLNAFEETQSFGPQYGNDNGNGDDWRQQHQQQQRYYQQQLPGSTRHMSDPVVGAGGGVDFGRLNHSMATGMGNAQGHIGIGVQDTGIGAMAEMWNWQSLDDDTQRGS